VLNFCSFPKDKLYVLWHMAQRVKDFSRVLFCCFPKMCPTKKAGRTKLGRWIPSCQNVWQFGLLVVAAAFTVVVALPPPSPKQSLLIQFRGWCPTAAVVEVPLSFSLTCSCAGSYYVPSDIECYNGVVCVYLFHSGRHNGQTLHTRSGILWHHGCECRHHHYCMGQMHKHQPSLVTLSSSAEIVTKILKKWRKNMRKNYTLGSVLYYSCSVVKNSALADGSANFWPSSSLSHCDWRRKVFKLAQGWALGGKESVGLALRGRGYIERDWPRAGARESQRSTSTGTVPEDSFARCLGPLSLASPEVRGKGWIGKRERRKMT